MAIYEYVCKKCGCEFEELVNGSDDTAVICKSCGGITEKKMSRFAPVIAGGTSVEPVDMSIGREAEKKWQMYHDRQSARRANKNLEVIDVPKSADGKFMPVMGLGNTEEKAKRTEFVSALQEHRQDREKKGISQFSESGAF